MNTPNPKVLSGNIARNEIDFHTPTECPCDYSRFPVALGLFFAAVFTVKNQPAISMKY